MNAPQKVIDLVEHFERNQTHLKSINYNETQLRREFLDPLFIALGWDVNNESGTYDAYKDVIHEDAIKVGGATKAPDYSFRVGGNRRFFVEAKKPAVNIIDNPEPAYQLRRYGWSAKLPLSILSDFEEFAVYDCRVKPIRGDKASTARTMFFTYQDYLTKWDSISSIFSKEAVWKGALDRYADENKLKKGTAAVDDDFLKEIESWREILAKNIAIRNESLTQRQLNEVVQKTIDRLIFLRICEDRGIETYGRLLGLINGSCIYERLGQYFYQADQKYNSGLFHFSNERNQSSFPDELSLSLNIDDKVLKGIIKNLYYPDCPYEFSVFSADILGQVYEQFLGKVIRLTAGHQAKVEEKPEVKKAGGVYYTPTYIVDYIVKNTVEKLIEGKTPRDVSEIKILDPACGSGSFLIVAYQRLLDWHLGWYLENLVPQVRKGLSSSSKAIQDLLPTQSQETSNKSKRKDVHLPILELSPNDWRLTTAERKRILLNNIFGVDIDAQAVEVTKLSLLLKVLESETEQTLTPQLSLFQERALPDLGNNIKCGNSLIGSDYYTAGKLFFDDEERFRVNTFDWHSEFREIMNRGGFDAVISNPPYGAYLYEQDKVYLKNKYTEQTYQLDSYLLFLEKAVKELLIKNGYFGMILPNPWLTNIFQSRIRKFIFEKCLVDQIVHFKYPVFPKVVVDTEIIILNKEFNNSAIVQVIIADSLSSFLSNPWCCGVRILQHYQEKWIELNGEVVNIFTSMEEERIAKKCRMKGVGLDEICDINVGIKPYQVGKGTPPQTRKDVSERPFDSNVQIDNSYRLCLRGKDINRFLINPDNAIYLKYGPWLAEPRPSANFDSPIKILMRQTGDSLVAALDTNKCLCLNNMHVIVPRNSNTSPLYLLGMINSKLLNWYYQILNPEAGEALAEVKKTNVAKLPIRPSSSLDQGELIYYEKIIQLVSQILKICEKLRNSLCSSEIEVIQRQKEILDKMIDQYVYQLYELSDEEIQIIENTGG